MQYLASHWTFFKDSATLLLAFFIGLFSLLTFKKNARTRKAEFILELHTAFFVDENKKYRDVRRKLDSEGIEADKERASLVAEEPEEFTDFLNFFELVSYLYKQKHLSLADVEALLGYYLLKLAHNREIRTYIQDKSKGFEQLNTLLFTLEKKAPSV